MGLASPMLSSSGEALWRRVVVEGWSEVCVGRVCFAFLTRGGTMAADCVHGGLAYIGVSVGGIDHGAITPTPQKTERACVGNQRKQPMDSWVNAASLCGELKGRNQSKDRVIKIVALHGNRATSVAGELKGLRAKQGHIITQRNKFLQTYRNQVIAQWFVRCSGTCRLRFDSGMQHFYFIFLTFGLLNKL